jgi:hypothetical protein
LALAARKRLTPEEPVPAANLNRDFPEPDGPETARGELASALWSFVREQKPDWLVDLHEGADFRSSGSRSVGSSVIVYPTPQARTAATQAAALGPDAAARVRRFVDQGGGYIGMCAGAYLACHGFPWSLSLLDAKTVSPLWRRGAGTVQMELTAKGQDLFDRVQATQDCRYANGPIIQPAQAQDVADYEVLAVFRSELAKNGTPKGVMVNSPAIVTGRFGRGRVLCSSPHPEQSQGWEAFVPRAVTWAAGDGREAPKN